MCFHLISKIETINLSKQFETNINILNHLDCPK